MKEEEQTQPSVKAEMELGFHNSKEQEKEDSVVISRNHALDSWYLYARQANATGHVSGRLTFWLFEILNKWSSLYFRNIAHLRQSLFLQIDI